MKYYNIGTDYEPKITGKRDGAFTVEKNKKSFVSKDCEAMFNGFFMENLEKFERTLLQDYKIFEIGNYFSLTYYPRTKSVRELDFMAYGPHEQGIQFLISRKANEIISEYKLPVTNKIPVKIDTFGQEYFLTGFPMLDFSETDFNKSTFFDYGTGKKVTYTDVADYQNAEYGRKLAVPQKLFLKRKFDYDIINTFKGIYFSVLITDKFKENNITGYCIKEGVLEN